MVLGGKQQTVICQREVSMATLTQLTTQAPVTLRREDPQRSANASTIALANKTWSIFLNRGITCKLACVFTYS